MKAIAVPRAMVAMPIAQTRELDSCPPRLTMMIPAISGTSSFKDMNAKPNKFGRISSATFMLRLRCVKESVQSAG